MALQPYVDANNPNFTSSVASYCKCGVVLLVIIIQCNTIYEHMTDTIKYKASLTRIEIHVEIKYMHQVYNELPMVQSPQFFQLCKKQDGHCLLYS